MCEGKREGEGERERESVRDNDEHGTQNRTATIRTKRNKHLFG